MRNGWQPGNLILPRQSAPPLAARE
jgi:hypothetical protein